MFKLGDKVKYGLYNGQAYVTPQPGDRVTVVTGTVTDIHVADVAQGYYVVTSPEVGVQKYVPGTCMERVVDG